MMIKMMMILLMMFLLLMMITMMMKMMNAHNDFRPLLGGRPIPVPEDGDCELDALKIVKVFKF